MKHKITISFLAVCYCLIFSSQAIAQSTNWELNGNSNIDVNDFIGTTNNAPLLFKTNGQPRLTITSDGRIGLGTSSPGVQFDVATGTICLRSMAGSESRLLLVNPDGAITRSGMLAPEQESWGDGGDCGLRIDGWGKCSSFGNELSLNPIYVKVRLGEDDANFPAPANMKLDVRGGLKAEGEVKVNGWGLKPTAGNDLEFNFMGIERMRLTQAGNLGINPLTPINPDVKMQVEAHPTNSTVALCALSDYDTDWKYNIKSVIHRDNTKAIAVVNNRTEEDVFRVWGSGLVEAKHVKIHRDGWADYVFADAYQLMSLEEVEQFVLAHDHLPGIPSEAEIIANGVDVGDMQAKLLEKIEELTLYVIALKKENAELRGRVTGLEKQK